LQNVQLWDEWGYAAYDELPAREYQALVAVLEGRKGKREEEAARGEAAARRARRGT
jgi:hypothetical protein